MGKPLSCVVTALLSPEFAKQSPNDGKVGESQATVAWGRQMTKIYFTVGEPGTNALPCGSSYDPIYIFCTGNETTVICDAHKKKKERDHTKYPKISHTINITTIIKPDTRAKQTVTNT